jgi:2-oxoglutarate ferredoxin oxidoreductase subunit alpha
MIFLVADIAFVPLEVFFVSLVLEKLIERQEEEKVDKKINMLVGLFYQEFGNEQLWQSSYVEDADYVFVAYGLAGRSTTGVVEQLRADGHKVGLIRPITLWPYPEKAFQEVNPNVKGYISVEENATGQMIDDIALTLKKMKDDSKPVYALTYAYGVPAMKTIKADYMKIVNGDMKEVY